MVEMLIVFTFQNCIPVFAKATVVLSDAAKELNNLIIIIIIDIINYIHSVWHGLLLQYKDTIPIFT